MDHLLYSPEDFARDESYLRYYFQLNAEDVAYWQDWISRHPEKLDVVVCADQLIALLSLSLPEDEFQAEYDRLLKDIGSGISVVKEVEAGVPLLPTRKNKRKIMQWGAVAVLVCLLSGAWLGWFSHRDHRRYEESLAGMDLKVNDARRSMEFELEEGTLIILEPGARLHFPHHFQESKREVYLEGDAFFKVSQSPSRPFYIYSNGLVTHVLGTSFSIKTDKLSRKTEVSVRTGRVEVYKKQAGPAMADDGQKKGNGVILSPNQKVIYEEGRQQFEVTLADIPLPIADPMTESHSSASADQHNQNSAYLAASLSTLIRSIKDTYGIVVEVENDKLLHCHFAGDISDMNLFDKLDAICKSINATYEVKGVEILIRGDGCSPSGE
jgi:transmembrane sensor